MKKILLISIISCSFMQAFSQPPDYGKINVNEWMMDNCSFDTAAKAVVLFDIGNAAIEVNRNAVQNDPECKLHKEYFLLTCKRRLRIKILHSEPDNSFSHSFTMPSHKFAARLLYFKCVSGYNENGSVAVKKYNIKDLKRSTLDDINYMTFEPAGLKDGTIIEFEYAIESGVYDKIPEWYYSSLYPTLYSEINYTAPDFFRFEIYSDIYNLLDHKSFNRDEHYSVSYPIQNGWKDVNYEFKENHETYSLRNIPAATGTDSKHMLRYSIKSIDFNSVLYKTGTWIRR